VGKDCIGPKYKGNSKFPLGAVTFKPLPLVNKVSTDISRGEEGS